MCSIYVLVSKATKCNYQVTTVCVMGWSRALHFFNTEANKNAMLRRKKNLQGPQPDSNVQPSKSKKQAKCLDPNFSLEFYELLGALEIRPHKLDDLACGILLSFVVQIHNLTGI